VNRGIALLICVFIISGSLLSTLFLLVHGEHKHDHDGVDNNCVICAHIQNAENILKQIGAAIKNAFIMSAGLLSMFAALSVIYFLTGFRTPVKLKVRINN